MGTSVAPVFLLVCASVSLHQFDSVRGQGLFVDDPIAAWDAMATVLAKERAQVLEPRAPSSGGGARRASQPAPLNVPRAVRVPTSTAWKDPMRPGTVGMAMPPFVKEVLSVTAAPAVSHKAPFAVVQILCNLDRIYTRVVRQLFGSKSAYKYLKLGNCSVNQATPMHYYFLYLLDTDCGFHKQSNVDDLSISTVLHFTPDPTSPVVRELSFEVPIECKYHRLIVLHRLYGAMELGHGEEMVSRVAVFRTFHSYQVGFKPKIEGGTIFKSLRSQTSGMIIAQDASGDEITGPKVYILGRPMYFEVTLSAVTAERVYVNECFMTHSRDPKSTPKYAVIENYGCMIDSVKSDRSKFIASTSPLSVKFSVSAFIFKAMASSSATRQQLYMHCEITSGSSTPTELAKACNYEAQQGSWRELYSDSNVCACCHDSSCGSAMPKSAKTITSSQPWEVDFSSSDEDVSEAEPLFNLFEAEFPDSEDQNLDYWDANY